MDSKAATDTDTPGAATAQPQAAPERAALIACLKDFVTEAKWSKMQQVLAQRTAHLRVVLEDIFQPHNASAALRSCEILGVQHLHIIENRYSYLPNKEVSMGAAKWVSLHRHRESDGANTQRCLRQLKAQGYRIVATALSQERCDSPESLPLDRPVALCFGTEEEGLSREALDTADSFLRVPMAGFTQSYNLSVTVALCLYTLTQRLRASGIDWTLPEAERQEVLLGWLRSSVREPEKIERYFWQQQRAAGMPER